MTFDLILYFVIAVLDPHKISRISKQKKTKLSEDPVPGDLDEFLATWAEIEAQLRALHEKLVSTVRFVPSLGSKSKPQIIQALEVLRNYGRISQNMWRKLDKLRQYHNLALHDPNMTVSQEMCDLAKELLAELDEK